MRPGGEEKSDEVRKGRPQSFGETELVPCLHSLSRTTGDKKSDTTFSKGVLSFGGSRRGER